MFVLYRCSTISSTPGVLIKCAGHVIPADHLLPLVLCKGPAGEDLEFSFQTRDRDKVVYNILRLYLLSVINLYKERMQSGYCSELANLSSGKYRMNND